MMDLHVGFFLAGMATTLLGPLLPALTRRWNIPDAVVGSVFSTQFVSTTILTVLSSSLVVRYSGTRVLAGGFLLIAAGVAALGVAPWPGALAATIVYGCGLGLVLPTTNFLVAEANPQHESSAVSLVNVTWGVGAVTWPLVVGWLGSEASVLAPILVLTVGVLLLAARLAVRARGTGSATIAAAVADTSAHAQHQDSGGAPRVAAALVAIFGAMMFLYSGTESAIGGWIAEHAHRLDPSSARWTLAPTCFWGAVASGRLLTPVWLRHRGEPSLLMLGLCLAAAGTLALVLVPSMPVAFVAATVAGLGLAPVFPTTLTAMSKAVRPSRPAWLGPLFALTGIGMAIVTWSVGYVSTLTGSLRAGFLVTCATILIMLALSAIRLRVRFSVHPGPEGPGLHQ
jgi:fucose permease